MNANQILISAIGVIHSPAGRLRAATLLGAAAVVLAACGCTVLTYTGPNGERFSRGSLGASTAIASLSVEAGTNGIRRVEMQGYQNDSNQTLTTITEAAVRAAIQAK